MSDWKEYKLGEIADIIPGFAFKSKDFGQGELVVKIKDIVPPYIDVNNADRVDISKYDEQKLNKYLLSKGDYVIAMTGATIGKIGKLKTNDKVYLNQRVAKIKAKTGVEDSFIYYTIGGDVFQLFIQNNIDSNSAQENISASSIGRYPIMLPPIDEQRQIAGVLSSLDDKIDLLHRENATLEALAETLFRHYFIENPNPEWKEAKLGDVAKIGIGRTPPRKETKWFSTSSIDVKWISIKDMGETGVYIFNTAEYLTREAVDCFKIPIIPNNTVVLSFKMTVGRIGITSEAMLSNEAIAHFILDDNSPVSKEYLYIFLKLFKFETLGSTSSIVTSINSAMIKEMKLIIPDKDTMMSFDKQVCPLFEKIKTNQQQILSLSTQRDTLLPRLMSSEVKIGE